MCMYSMYVCMYICLYLSSDIVETVGLVALLT